MTNPERKLLVICARVCQTVILEPEEQEKVRKLIAMVQSEAGRERARQGVPPNRRQRRAADRQEARRG